MGMIAALYVETDGCYFNLPDVDPWDEARDARKYAGPFPVVAHPPCQRWGRFWHGSTRKPHRYQLGADDGCFVAAIGAVRRLYPVALAKHGYEKARRIGMVAMIGGKRKSEIRNATMGRGVGTSRRYARLAPLPFRDLLLSIARIAC
jgi:hypothetical protein